MMVAFLRALGLERVVVGGHSLGGAIAMRVAILAPEVRGLVLMNPGIIETGVPKIAEYYFFPLERLSAKQFGSRSFRESFLKTSYVNPDIITPEIMDDLMLTVRSEGYMSGMTSMMGQYVAASEGPLLPEIRVPTLIAWGVEDKRKDEAELQALVDGLRNSPRGGSAARTRTPATMSMRRRREVAEVAAGMRAALPMWAVGR